MIKLGIFLPGCITKANVMSEGRFKADEMIDEVYLGHVISAGCGQAPAAQAIRLAGLPLTIPATTVNKVCTSGMKVVSVAAAQIKSGAAECIVTGGMESMSFVPFSIPNQLRCPNRGLRFGNSELTDLLAKDGLTDAETGLPMGEAAERIAERLSISREEMDIFSKRSFEAALASRQLFENEEIVSVSSSSDSKTLTMLDDGPKTFKPEKIASLRTPFRPGNGRVTAASSSQLTDGAAAIILMSGDMVQKLGIKPLARVISCADAGMSDAMDFPIAPAKAIEKCQQLAGMSEADIDLYEINEAFSVVPLAVMKMKGIPETKVNILGGAVALGHPLGASGTRIIGTLITALKSQNKKTGCAAICNGGGGASAIILELCA